MTEPQHPSQTHAEAPEPPPRGLLRALLKLARPHQWAKSAFVLLGPLYGVRDYHGPWQDLARGGLLAAGAFALASSACYVVNDLLDAPHDRAHPRKKYRPIARGEVSQGQAAAWALVLLAAAAGLLVALDSLPAACLVVVYVLNVLAYSAWLKHRVIADVMSLSLGFVIRVVGGCAAVGIAPSNWLLNVTLFLSMFLAFGKRLGERRSHPGLAEAAREVQRAYTDELLRMLVGVTGVATLVTYAAYVVSRTDQGTTIHLWHPHGDVGVLWPTLLPATYALLRTIVMLERGRYEDPTDLVMRDWPMRLAAVAFVGLTGLAVFWARLGLT